MRLLCDADVDAPLVRRLRSDGHEVVYVAEREPRLPDDHVLELANALGALLITRDKGFGQLVFRQGRASYGVLLIRLAGIPMAERSELLAAAVSQHAEELLGSFAVLTRGGLRIRKPFQ